MLGAWLSSATLQSEDKIKKSEEREARGGGRKNTDHNINIYCIEGQRTNIVIGGVKEPESLKQN